MTIVDAGIIVLIIFFGLTGFRNGFLKQLVLTVGTFLVFFLAYYFKDVLGDFLALHLPFLDFSGSFFGLQVVNIILYKMIAFIILLILFSFIFGIIVKLTGFIEKILKCTVILAIPSKILGFILGAIEGYVIVFVILFFLSQPAVKFDVIGNSKYASRILNSSIILSKATSNMAGTIQDMYGYVERYLNDKDADKFNADSIDDMLKNGVVSKEYIEKLIEKGKLNVAGISDVLNKY